MAKKKKIVEEFVPTVVEPIEETTVSWDDIGESDRQYYTNVDSENSEYPLTPEDATEAPEKEKEDRLPDIIMVGSTEEGSFAMRIAQAFANANVLCKVYEPEDSRLGIIGSSLIMQEGSIPEDPIMKDWTAPKLSRADRRAAERHTKKASKNLNPDKDGQSN